MTCKSVICPTICQALRQECRDLVIIDHTVSCPAPGAQNFLLHGRTGADRNYDWLEYFDVVITGAVILHCPAVHCLRLTQLLCSPASCSF